MAANPYLLSRQILRDWQAINDFAVPPGRDAPLRGGLTMLEYSKLFIGGQWVSPSSTKRIEVRSPHTHELVGSGPDAGADDVDRAVVAARGAFDTSDWRHLKPAQRAEALARLREAYVRRIPLIAELHSQQMGCPIRFAKPLHAQLPVTVLDYYLQLANDFPFEQTRQGLRHD